MCSPGSLPRYEVVVLSVRFIVPSRPAGMRYRGREPGRVPHEPLAQLVTADVGGTDQDNGPLPVRSGVVEGHLLVYYRLLTC